MFAWGDTTHDGLYFLAYYIYILPALIILSIINAVLIKRRIMRFSYILYIVLMTIPAIISIKSQMTINLGVLVCLSVFIVNTLGLFIIKNHAKK